MGLKSSTIEQAKLEYSPLGKIFNKGLKEEGKEDGPFKRLKNIEGKNEDQFKATEDQGKKYLEEIRNINIGSKPLKTIKFFSTINEKVKTLMKNIKQIDGWLDPAQLFCTKTGWKTKHDFNKFTFPLKFTSKIHHCDLMLQEAEDDQQELEILINKLNNGYSPRNEIKIREKKRCLKLCKINCFL